MNFNLSIPLLTISAGTMLTACSVEKKTEEVKPNIIFIFLDDAAWGDFRPFTEPRYPTPNIDQLAREGRSFYNFYVPQAICSASRGALLTGCYPEHTKLVNAHAPRERGLEPTFMTMGESFQKINYRTGWFGKWHLGDQEDTRPHVRGFDETAGIMYSNDMWAAHPENPGYWGRVPLSYWENGKVTIDSITADHQKFLTTWVTEKSVDFITRHKDQPFFLYVPHPMPHVPLFVSEKFDGKSGIGLYADVMMELDWSVGEIMKAIKENGLEENTLVIFTSDNGPWISYGHHAGQSPFRGDKATSWDGGVRSPLIIKYPGKLDANSISFDTFFSIDFFPTFNFLTGCPLPDYEIDGKNVWDVITGKPSAVNPHDFYSITIGHNLDAIMTSDGKWKLHLPHEYRYLINGGVDGMPGRYETRETELALYDMVHDPYEKMNVVDHYPDIVNQLLEYSKIQLKKYPGRSQ